MALLYMAHLGAASISIYRIIGGARRTKELSGAPEAREAGQGAPVTCLVAPRVRALSLSGCPTSARRRRHVEVPSSAPGSAWLPVGARLGFRSPVEAGRGAVLRALICLVAGQGTPRVLFAGRGASRCRSPRLDLPGAVHKIQALQGACRRASGCLAYCPPLTSYPGAVRHPQLAISALCSPGAS